MTARMARLRRSSLAVPGINEKMLAKAAASKADQVFCDLEDAVATTAKVEARQVVATALNELDWGSKVRSVRVNDPSTQWCYEDIITLLELAGDKVDTIILPKALAVADVLFADRLISQIEMKLKLPRRIGLEVLIEDVEALQNVAAIAKCSDRLECLIFGWGDYSLSQGMQLGAGGEANPYPGDIFYYPRYQITVAARAAGIDAIDGPSIEFRDMEKYRRECFLAAQMGMTGKWAIHPAQIEPALEVFSPSHEEVNRAREVVEAFEKAKAGGIGVINHGGAMIDAATVGVYEALLRKADQIGM